MLEVLIIEDEAKAARELSSIIAKLRPQWRITGVTESVEQTLMWLAENKAPSLIFSDIQLGDGLSFEIFAQHSLTCPIIFCTAFDEHAIRAFENNGIDYVLKPLSEARLERSIQKLENLSHVLKQNTSTESVIYSSLLTAFRNWPKSSLLVHFRGKIFPLRTSDIGFIYYDGNSTIAHSKDGQQYVLQQRLDALELALDKLQFFRANRQFIIHRGSVVEVENYFSRKLVVKLGAKTPEPVVISKAKASLFLAWLQH